jgi:DNA-binding CsgD family transcriptional regulator
MNNRERAFIAIVLSLIVVLVTTDLVTDLSEGVRWWHAVLEGAIAASAGVGIFLVIRNSLALKHSLAEERRHSSELQAEAEKWRAQSRKYLEGLSQSIDAQLTRWYLTGSEKEVAFLLLKGLSLKEIAEIRQTTEKTARTQSMAVYSKAGLAGRSELAAFFLEDLLPPAAERSP